jgi:hypothetical protein
MLQDSDALADPWICFISAFSSLLRLLFMLLLLRSNLDTAWLCCLYDVFDLWLMANRKTSHYSIATGFMALGMMLPEWQVDSYKNI